MSIIQKIFAYNTGSAISGTSQVGDIAISEAGVEYSANYGGLQWWGGPDESLGYVIASPVSGNTQQTPVFSGNSILSPTYKGNDITLVNSQSALQQFGYQQSVLGQTLINNVDKVMFSVQSNVCTNLGNPFFQSIGVGTTSMNYQGTPTPYGAYPGNDTQSVGFSMDGNFYFNGSIVQAFGLPTWTSGDTIDVAVNLNNDLIWIRVNGGAWAGNPAGANDPATNQGGLSLNGLTSFYPVLSPGNDSGRMTIQNTAIYGLPDGYQLLGTNVNASLKFYGTKNMPNPLSESTFVELTNQTFNQSFTNGNDASTWLTNNGYWNSWVSVTPTPTATLGVTPTPTPTVTTTQTPTTTTTNTPTPTLTPTNTPTQTTTPTNTPTPTITPTNISCLNIATNAGGGLTGFNVGGQAVAFAILANPAVGTTYPVGSFITFQNGEVRTMVQIDDYGASYDVFYDSPISSLTLFPITICYPSIPTPTPTTTSTPTGTPSVTSTPTPSVTTTLTPTNTSTPTPTPTSGSTGVGWFFYYANNGPVVSPPTNNGNTAFITGNGTYNPNYTGGTLSIFFNNNDSAGTSYASQFSGLDTTGGTITISQGSSVAIYSGTSAEYNLSGTYLQLQVTRSTQMIQSASTAFVSGTAINVVVNNIPGVTPTPTPSNTATPITQTPTPTNTATPTGTPPVTPTNTSTPPNTPTNTETTTPTPTVTPSSTPAPNQIIVAAGGVNALSYSYDGDNWVNSSNGATFVSQPATAVAASPTLFVAGGSGGSTSRLIYSNDGITWSASTNGNTLLNSVFGVAYGGGKFVAVGISASASAGIVYSTDGITWTASNSLVGVFGSTVTAVAFNGSRWVATAAKGGAGNVIAYSDDAITWTASSNGTSIFSGGSDTVRAVVWGTNRWVVLGGSTNRFAYSNDGITWSASTSGNALITGIGYGVGYNGSQFVGGGQGTNSLVYSNDGITWSASTNGNSTFSLIAYCVTWDSVNSQWITGGIGTNQLAKSSNGITWSPTTNGNTIMNNRVLALSARN